MTSPGPLVWVNSHIGFTLQHLSTFSKSNPPIPKHQHISSAPKVHTHEREDNSNASENAVSSSVSISINVDSGEKEYDDGSHDNSIQTPPLLPPRRYQYHFNSVTSAALPSPSQQSGHQSDESAAVIQTDSQLLESRRKPLGSSNTDTVQSVRHSESWVSKRSCCTCILYYTR